MRDNNETAPLTEFHVALGLKTETASLSAISYSPTSAVDDADLRRCRLLPLFLDNPVPDNPVENFLSPPRVPFNLSSPF